MRLVEQDDGTIEIEDMEDKSREELISLLSNAQSIIDDLSKQLDFSINDFEAAHSTIPAETFPDSGINNSNVNINGLPS